MTSFRSALGTFALSSLILTAALPARAQEAAAIGERIKAMFREQGVELTYAGASGNPSEMKLRGATVRPTGEKNQLAIGDITLSEVSDDAGTISIGSMDMSTFQDTRDGIEITIDGVSVSDLILPPAGDATKYVSYRGAEIGEVSVTKAGTDKELFGLTNFSIDVTPPEAGSPFGFTGSAEQFSADLTAIEDPNAQKIIRELGYDTLDGSLDLAGSWNPTDGRTVLSKYDVQFNDAGTIGLTLDVGGYTPDFQKALRETQAKLVDAPAGGDNSAAGMAMLGLMQQLTLNGASLRFDDDTLTKKILDYFGKMQGAKGSDIANQAKALMPFMLAQLNNPEFANQVTAAASRFLDDPKSLTVTVKPAQPLPFAMVAAGAMTAPQSLPQQLGVTVTAND